MQEYEETGIDTGLIMLITVFSLSFSIPVIVWCVHEIKTIKWNKILQSEQAQELIRAVTTTKEVAKNKVKNRESRK